MKCPKCSYLGFETGDRCKNCGYDFSLMTDDSPEPIEIDLDIGDSRVEGPGAVDWLGKVDRAEAAASVHSEPDLPLFTPAFDDGGDEPLIKLPPAPRPPLAVRRTPDTPRFRAVPKPVRRLEPEPALAFEDEGGVFSAHDAAAEAVRRPISRVWAEPEIATAVAPDSEAEVSGPGARLAAAAIDHLILAGIDLGVLYFTLRMAGLSMSDWTALPPAPIVAFLLLVKLSYFYAFTAVGGQTIGKMAARIRVVSTDDRPMDAALALRRTLAAAASTALLGLGFVPALFGSERRALHDRVARTRVIALPSA